MPGPRLLWALALLAAGAAALPAAPAAVLALAAGASAYSKPDVSSYDCVKAVEAIAARTADEGNDGACMSCDPTKPACAPGCQGMVDDMYWECDGVTLPDGFFYDPDELITGTWSNSVKREIKIAVERCGCDSGSALAPSVLLVSLVAGVVGLLLG